MSATGRAATGSAGRVIAGTARGTRLVAPGPGTRPLGDRLKEALFAILEPELRDGAVLDLFAGSGAGGIEALSRGARTATFVERDPATIAVIRANVARTHVAQSAVIVQAEVIAWLDAAIRAGNGRDGGPFRVILVDPPYDQPDLLVGALERLGHPGRLLAAGATVVAKHGWRDQPRERIGLLGSVRTRRLGETMLTFYRTGATEEQA